MKTRILLLFLLAFSFAKSQTISTRVGSTSGYVEGTGTAALFNRPYGIAIDGGSAVVVTDQNNNRVRKIYSDNSTGFWAGSATSGTIINGTGAAARFNSLTGVARDGFNNAYVCDSGNHAIRKITSAGVVTTFAGGTLGTADGTGTAAQFNYPEGIAIDASGNLYVTDVLNHRIRKITPAGVVTTLAGSTNGYADGTGTAARFSNPSGIAVDASGNVFVGENCRIRKITPAGVVTTFAGGTVGYLDGNGTAAQFNIGILGIAIDNLSNLYVADSYNYRIRKITPTGVVSTYAGLGYSGTTDGDVSVATFDVITGIAINTAQNILYIVDHFNNRIRAIAPSLKPDILSPTVTPNFNFATVNYSLNAKNFATTSVVKYGLTSSNLTNQVTGISASGTSNVNGNVTLPALSPDTTYYYQIEATNSAGTTVSSGSFQTALPPQIDYTFDNTLSDVNGVNAFLSQPGMTYGTNRLNIANKALFINGTGTTVSLTNLPVGNSSRTFSIWIKPTQFNGANRIFSYGSPSGTAAYGASFDATKVYNFSWTNNLSFVQYTSLNVWKHIVCTFEQSTNTARLYIDGVLRSNAVLNWSTANNGIFYLGSLFGETGSSYIGFIDDLQIYNYALSNAEVTNLYNNDTLSSSDFSQNNIKVSLYPNPVNDVLNIEMDSEIKSVEIYNLQGQKVKTALSKQVNVAELASGIYMVRIQDENNAVETRRIVKN